MHHDGLISSGSGGRDPLHVIVVGAGITGLLITQGLKKAGIESSIFEAQESAAECSTRSGEWGLAIHWALPALKDALPAAVFDRVDPEASVDPEYTTQDPDWLPIVNLQTGELLKRLEMPKTIRVSRKKMRALLAEGIEVNYAKRLSEIRTTEDGQVAAYFHDGSHVTGDCLVAAEGARSVARIKLVGTDAAVIQTVPFLGSRVVFRYPSAEQALSARQLHPVQSMGIHPEGIWAFIAVLDVPDNTKPETWTFQMVISRRADADSSEIVISGVPSALGALKQMAQQMADPFRSAILNIPDESPVYEIRLGYWEPIERDNLSGRVALAGDSAHPMTLHRGQGLNHAIADAALYVNAIADVAAGKQSLVEAVNDYDREVIKRGGDEVRNSKANTFMLHNWEQVQQSPLFQGSTHRKT